MKQLFFLLIVLGVLWFALGKPSSVAEIKSELQGWTISHNGQAVSAPVQAETRPPQQLNAYGVTVCCVIPILTLLAVGGLLAFNRSHP